jgi:predicted DNA-binding transcriptional regulator YafY
MRGLQLSRQWRVIRAIEAGPNGLTVTGIDKREETGTHKIHRDPEALQATGSPLYTERVERPTSPAFKDIFKFQFSQELMKLNWQRESPRPVRS